MYYTTYCIFFQYYSLKFTKFAINLFNCKKRKCYMSKKLKFTIYFLKKHAIIDLLNYVSGGKIHNVNKKKVVNGW